MVGRRRVEDEVHLACPPHPPAASPAAVPPPTHRHDGSRRCWAPCRRPAQAGLVLSRRALCSVLSRAWVRGVRGSALFRPAANPAALRGQGGGENGGGGEAELTGDGGHVGGVVGVDELGAEGLDGGALAGAGREDHHRVALRRAPAALPDRADCGADLGAKARPPSGACSPRAAGGGLWAGGVGGSQAAGTLRAADAQELARGGVKARGRGGGILFRH